MRDILILFPILAGMAAAARYPFAGVLVWAWFSIMTPHQLAYGVFGIPLNTLIAGGTIAALVVNGGVVRFRPDWTSLWIAFFAVWILLSQAFSLDPELSAPHADRFVKVLIFAFLCAQMADTKLKIHALLWMFAIGLGYFAIKGGLFTLLTLGQYRVHGIEETLLEDNNHMGVALAAALPIMLYLFGEARLRLTKIAIGATSAATAFAILGTQSRGAFISLVVFAGFFWLQSKRKFSLLAALALVAAPAIAFMPSSWSERMGTIAEASEDDSFMGRVNAWVINTELAKENPITGAGFRNSYYIDIAARVVSDDRAQRARAAHSIYFEVLGGVGFVGLGVYLAMLGSGVWGAFRLSRSKAESPDSWRSRFGYFALISLAVFGVGGASTSMEMWDGYLIVIAMVAAAFRLHRRALGEAPLRLGGQPSASRPPRSDARTPIMGSKRYRLRTD